MENFNERGRGVREKNVYLLHLDTPRIIIISCVLIGVLIIAFLFGMNYSSEYESRSKRAYKQMTLDPLFSSKDNDPLVDKIESEKVRNELGLLDEKPAEPAKDNSDDVKKDILKSDLAENSTNQKSDPSDILDNENIREIIPPASTVKRSQKKKTAAVAPKRKKQPSRIAKRSSRNRSNRIVEVAGNNRLSKSDVRKGFHIQVGSFDTRTKARDEKRNLKKHRYDSYIESALVNGKKYYRVRIGPISSRRRAENMLSELQEIDEYNGSYLVKE